MILELFTYSLYVSDMLSVVSDDALFYKMSAVFKINVFRKIKIRIENTTELFLSFPSRCIFNLFSKFIA